MDQCGESVCIVCPGKRYFLPDTTLIVDQMPVSRRTAPSPTCFRGDRTAKAKRPMTRDVPITRTSDRYNTCDHLETIRSFYRNILYNTQLIQSISPLNLESLLIRKMQKTDKAETSANIRQYLLRINSIQPTDNFSEFPRLNIFLLLLQSEPSVQVGG